MFRYLLNTHTEEYPILNLADHLQPERYRIYRCIGNVTIGTESSVFKKIDTNSKRALLQTRPAKLSEIMPDCPERYSTFDRGEQAKRRTDIWNLADDTKMKLKAVCANVKIWKGWLRHTTAGRTAACWIWANNRNLNWCQSCSTEEASWMISVSCLVASNFGCDSIAGHWMQSKIYEQLQNQLIRTLN